MVRAIYDSTFRKRFSKIKDALLKEKIIKQIEKLRDDPELGKPMRYSRKGTREVYMPPFRLSYVYRVESDTIEFLDFYHKDEQ
jgi:mRNA-degrading endonuclease RelE of RelBE toxin-antitoxin system